MSDFTLLQNVLNGKWVVSAPRRSHRTNVSKDASVCPFCPGQEEIEEELYRVPSTTGSMGTTASNAVDASTTSSFSRDTRDTLGTRDTSWSVRVIKNKFPFAPHHELIIHSPDHHKNWDELPFSQVELILRTYRERYNFHKKDGPHSAEASRGKAGLPAGRQVYIFHNRGHAAGESIPHPHTQLVVIPHKVKLDITPLDQEIYKSNSSISNLPFSNNPQTSISKSANKEINGKWNMDNGKLETEHFFIFCPKTSEWPDEVWVAPKHNGGGFGFIKDGEITDLGFVLSRLIQIFDLRHGHEFAFNFYIAPLKNWYLRLIPRKKILGGFELGTGIIVNTQDSKETFGFIREHFWMPDRERIKSHNKADYHPSV